MENVDKKDTHLINMRYLLLYFLIYAMIGWLLETVYAVGTLGYFVKRGFLYGPLCPIYGCRFCIRCFISCTFLGLYK